MIMTITNFIKLGLENWGLIVLSKWYLTQGFKLLKDLQIVFNYLYTFTSYSYSLFWFLNNERVSLSSQLIYSLIISYHLITLNKNSIKIFTTNPPLLFPYISTVLIINYNLRCALISKSFFIFISLFSFWFPARTYCKIQTIFF